MPFDAHANGAISAVATAPSPATSGTSLVVTAAQGALFPAAPFNVTIWPANTAPLTTNWEIARVTAVSTDTLTIVRAQEGTSARTVIVGDQIIAGITAKTLTDAEQATGWIPDSNTWTVVNVPTNTSVSTGGAATPGIFTKSAHGYSNGMAVVVTGLTNTTGPANGFPYYIVAVSGNNFEISQTPGGTAVNFGGTADTSTITVTGWNQFTVPVDASTYLAPDTKISYNDGGVDYGVVASAVNNSGTTTVTLIYNSDYAVANATLTSPRYSYTEEPQGFPTAGFNFVPVLVGWSGSPPTSTVYRWSTVGRRITVTIRQVTATTSTGTLHTMTLPVLAAVQTNGVWGNPCRATDNSAIGVGWLQVAASGNVMTLGGVLATNTNTASGTSAILGGNVTYEY